MSPCECNQRNPGDCICDTQGPSDEDLQRMAREMDDAGERAERLARDLIAIVRAHAGGMQR